MSASTGLATMFMSSVVSTSPMPSGAACSTMEEVSSVRVVGKISLPMRATIAATSVLMT